MVESVIRREAGRALVAEVLAMSHASTDRMKRFTIWVAAPLTGLLLGAGSLQAMPTAPNVLRVVVVEGSQPCSFREGGAWQGLAVLLWSQIAQRERIPYVLQPMPSIRAMLEATRNGELDVAVECINLSPDRLRRYRFSLPFQEDGQALMVISNPFSLGQAFLSALFSGTLLRLLLVTLVLTLALTGSVWWVEEQPERRSMGWRHQLRGFSRVFAVMVTGSGDDAVVTTSRGRALVLLAYLVRLIVSAVLVGFLTVELVQEAQGRAGRRVQRLSDLAGLRVGLKPGTVSETLVHEINRSSGADQAVIVPIAQIDQALNALGREQIDVMLADELQLRYLIASNQSPNIIPVLAIQGIRPELQGFALSPSLPADLVRRIDLAISELKRSGVVQDLHRQALAGSEELNQDSRNGD